MHSICSNGTTYLNAMIIVITHQHTICALVHEHTMWKIELQIAIAFISNHVKWSPINVKHLQPYITHHTLLVSKQYPSYTFTHSNMPLHTYIHMTLCTLCTMLSSSHHTVNYEYMDMELGSNTSTTTWSTTERSSTIVTISVNGMLEIDHGKHVNNIHIIEQTNMSIHHSMLLFMDPSIHPFIHLIIHAHTWSL